ncbi:hypothetical protein PCL_04055 [Purpureocillium lilacinum]|uniref:Uncharacterized protein n=1 Tax=Purpureocillium lilacinum TaxID=33203 RepID=A0A2U3EQU5_PURLI|nr:hypothetical protein Purlil1_3411 [Purpureocillium lilacinum]PWI76861.1 hypothetical protein PCL_04055 [Purpureocillium lilacinum]
MEYKFGLSLLHRHFDIGEEERMVEYRGTSSPWSACLSMTGPAIRAINWAVADDGTFRPFEFEYSPDDRDSIEPSNPENAKFADAFKALLHDEHAAGLFGICAHPGLGFKGRVEITEGRTNINLSPELRGSSTPSSGVLVFASVVDRRTGQRATRTKATWGTVESPLDAITLCLFTDTAVTKPWEWEQTGSFSDVSLYFTVPRFLYAAENWK